MYTLCHANRGYKKEMTNNISTNSLALRTVKPKEVERCDYTSPHSNEMLVPENRKTHHVSAGG